MHAKKKNCITDFTVAFWFDLNSVFHCIAVCTDPGIPFNGNRIGNDFSEGQMVAFSCDSNFTLVGPSLVFCVAGQWDATTPTCKGMLWSMNGENEVTVWSLTLAIKLQLQGQWHWRKLSRTKGSDSEWSFSLKIRTYRSILIYTHLHPLVFHSYV